MNKIKKKIPDVKFSSSNISGTSGFKKGKPRSVAIKESQSSVQSEHYRGPIRKHNSKSIKIVNHFAKTASAFTASHLWCNHQWFWSCINLYVQP